MAVVSNKTGNTSEPFNVFKQKFGKQTTFKGFKQHFSSITSINQERSPKTSKTSVVFKEDESIEEKRGFVPSDVLNDPSKREFLTQLSKRMWMEKEKFLSRCRVLRNVPYLQWFYLHAFPLSATPWSDLIFTFTRLLSFVELFSHLHTRADCFYTINMWLTSTAGIRRYSGLGQLQLAPAEDYDPSFGWIWLWLIEKK